MPSNSQKIINAAYEEQGFGLESQQDSISKQLIESYLQLIVDLGASIKLADPIDVAAFEQSQRLQSGLEEFELRVVDKLV